MKREPSIRIVKNSQRFEVNICCNARETIMDTKPFKEGFKKG
jgi:hypothetical protein